MQFRFPTDQWFKVFALIWLALIVFAATWSLWRPEIFRVHDFVQVARVAEMARGILDGQWPVRWSANFGFGYGMPAFLFYAPFPYYVGASLYLLGLPGVVVLKILMIIPTILTVSGGYFLGERLTRSRWGGVLAATAMALAPYRAVNIFVRGAISESWGMMTLPWLIFAIVKLIDEIQGDRRHSLTGKYWWLLWLSLVVLMLSHNLSAFMIGLQLAVVTGVGLAWKWWQEPHLHRQWWRVVTKMTTAGVLALGSTAYYWMPLMLEQHFTKVSRILGGYFDFHQHFVYLRQFIQPNWGYGGSIEGPADGLSFFIGWGQLAGLLLLVMIFLGGAVYYWWHRSNLPRPHLWWSKGLVFGGVLVAAAGSLLLTTAKSQLIWEVLPGFSLLQFPWRWLGSASVWIACATALGVSTLPRRFSWSVGTLILTLCVLGNIQFFQPESYLKNPEEWYDDSPETVQTQGSETWPDYIPVQMAEKLTPPTAAAWFTELPGESSGQLEVVERSGHKLRVNVQVEQPATIALAIAEFPGWQIWVDDQQLRANTVSTVGNLTVSVPAGRHQVFAEFAQTPIRANSDALSVFSMAVILLIAYLWWKEQAYG